MTTKTLQEQLAAAKREVALRKIVYPKQLVAKKPGWTADKVRHEIECMEAIVETIKRLIDLEEASNDLFKRPTQQVPFVSAEEEVGQTRQSTIHNTEKT